MQNNNPRTITITGMTGDESVQKVRAALKNVSGVTTENVAVGQATITCAYPAAHSSACAAITSAGYRVSSQATNLNVNSTPAPSVAPVHTSGHQTDDVGADVIGSIGDIKPQDQHVDAPAAAGAEPREPIVVAV